MHGLFEIRFDLHFLTSLISIVIIDLLLAGDNAVMIAMAVRRLPAGQRTKGIIFGSATAVVLRVILTFVIAQMLQLSFIKIIGGVLIFWISVRLFAEGVPQESIGREAKTIWQAVRIIVISDITMATDNMLAVGGASHGDLFLLIFGLGLSIPFVVFASHLLSTLMERYPAIIYIGAAILGKVSGEMIMTDPFTIKMFNPGKAAQYYTEAAFAAGVIAAGWLHLKWMISRNNRDIDNP